jgi:hypothetical protein
MSVLYQDAGLYVLHLGIECNQSWMDEAEGLEGSLCDNMKQGLALEPPILSGCVFHVEGGVGRSVGRQALIWAEPTSQYRS